MITTTVDLITYQQNAASAFEFMNGAVMSQNSASLPHTVVSCERAFSKFKICEV